MASFRGIIPPVSTLFAPDGSFDCIAQARLIDKMIAGGVHGLFFLGSNGEAAHMSSQMRFEVAEFCVAHVAERVPTLVGIGVPSTTETIRFGRHAAKHGATGAVVINPYYAKLSEENLYRYFRDIAEALDLPLMVYNFPAVTGQDLSPELVLRLACDCPSIIGLKDTVDTQSHIRRAIHLIKPVRPDFLVFAGFEEYLLDTLIMGGDGCVPASGNFAPQLTVELYQAYRSGDYAKVIAAQQRLVFIPSLYTLESPFFGVVKEAMKMTGFGNATTVLPPSSPASAASIEKIRTALGQAGLMKPDPVAKVA